MSKVRTRRLSFLMKTSMFTASTTDFVKWRAEISLTNKAKFYVPSTIIGNRDKEATLTSLFTGSFPPRSFTSKQDNKENKEKKKEASHFSEYPCKKCSQSRCSSEYYKVVRRNRGGKGIKVLRSITAHFSKAVSFNTIYSNKMIQKYDENISGKIAK